MGEDNFGAHFHLVVNDIPILRFFFASVFLLASIITKEGNAWARALLTLSISFVGMILAFFSGDPALKVIDGQPQTSARALTQHHVRGLVAGWFCFGYYSNRYRSSGKSAEGGIVSQKFAYTFTCWK